MKHLLLISLFTFLTFGSIAQTKSDKIKSQLFNVFSMRATKLQNQLRADSPALFEGLIVKLVNVNIIDATENGNIIYVFGTFTFSNEGTRQPIPEEPTGYIAKFKDVLGESTLQLIYLTDPKIDNGKPLEVVDKYFSDGKGTRLFPATN